MNIRYVNYYITENGDYANCEKHIITLNKLVQLDANFNYISLVDLEKNNINGCKMFSLDFNGRRYMGIEDVRIFNSGNAFDKIQFIGNALHENGNIGIVFGNYNTENDDNKKNILHYTELKQTFNVTECEKNWVYIPTNGKSSNQLLVYHWFPLTICEVNVEKNSIIPVEKKDMPLIFSRVRGSTCGCLYSVLNESSQEIWFITHLVSYEKPRHYYHMIVVFDSNMKLLRYSAPFKLSTFPIEYCLGLIVERERVILSYSTMDRTTHVATYDKKYIESLLVY
jgi:hypothetical protein